MEKQWRAWAPVNRRLPTAVGRLARGNLLVVDLIAGVRSPHDRNQPSLARRLAAHTGRTARERRRSIVDSIEAVGDANVMTYPTNEVARDAVRGEAASAAPAALAASAWRLFASVRRRRRRRRPRPDSSSAGDAGSDESVDGGDHACRRSVAAQRRPSRDRWRFARNP